MAYYLMVENNEVIGRTQSLSGGDIIDVEVSEDLYNDYESEKYIYSNGEIILNPDWEQIQADKRRTQFYGDFFATSLGFIRRKVSMKTGETKDFLTDLLPVISMAVNNGQVVSIITYREPDSWLQDVTNWEELQEIKQATSQFVLECFNQVSVDFTGL